jgi:Ca-activated chloride channel family protein
MRRTFALVALALSSLAAAAMAALLRPLVRPAPPTPQTQAVQDGTLRMTAHLDRRYLPEAGGGEAFLEIDLAAAPATGSRRRVPVNAVLILDRSGSMSGAKMDRARDAARALVQALTADDRLSIVEFSSEASVLFASAEMDPAARARALDAIDRLDAMGGTNLSAAFDIAAPELARGHARGRVDKVFLASDGQANEGISERDGLLRLAQRDFAGATLSSFGIGEDYDEDLMSALAAQAGGRARYISSPQVLAGAFRDELGRAAAAVARDVRLRIRGLSGASVVRVLGYGGQGGEVRLPDFAAGEERRVLVKLALPPGRGAADLARVELELEDAASGEPAAAQVVAQGAFTSDAAQLSLPPGPAALEGARAEMAELAEQAARLQESGRREEAKARITALHGLAGGTVVGFMPAQRRVLEQDADEYDRGVSAIDAPGGAASKTVKQKAFDAVRAPVAGW